MDTHAAIRHMVKASGLSAYQVSRDIGRTLSYVSTVLQRAATTTDTMADIAHACGYRLILASEDGKDSIELDGTRH